MIQTRCGSCGKAYKLPDGAAGKKAKCKGCQAVMMIPAAGSAAGADPLGGTGTNDGPSLDDLSALYQSDGHTSPDLSQGGAVEADLGFDPQVSFNYQPTKKSMSLPMPLILGAGGGLLGLILIVVVVVVVFMGGDDQAEESQANASTGGLALSGLTMPDLPDPVDEPADEPAAADPEDGADGDDDAATGLSSTPETGDPAGENDPGDVIASRDDLPGEITAAVDEGEGSADEPTVVTAGDLDIASQRITPNGKPYSLLLPDGFEVASSTRVAVRTRPMADGRWLSMEVHRLSSVDRRQPTPINASKGTVLLRGHRVSLPGGVEVSELASDAFAIHRLLYPEPAEGQPRRVAYVIKDGAYLITVRGLYPADAPEQLDAFDDVALSIRKQG